MEQSKRTVPARPNIYTVLALISFLALAGAVGFVWSENVAMTKADQQEVNPGSSGNNPWFVVPKTDNQKSVQPPAGS